jgi:hypothetical protein
VRALWADGDRAEVPEGFPAPSIAVESSPGRTQLYWCLTGAVEPEVAERLNKRIASAIGADMSGYDLTQLLRPPGTYNHKYDDTPEVSLAIRTGEVYEEQQLDWTLPELSESENGHVPTEQEIADEPPVKMGDYGLVVWRGQKPVLKEDGSIDRSGTLFKIGCVLAEAGATKRTITTELSERDRALGYHKYTDHPKEYRRIAKKAFDSVTDANTANTRGGDAVPGGTLPPPVPFPVDALPEIPRRLVLEGAASTGTTVDMFAAMVLTALGGAVGTSRQLVLKRNWREYPAIWSCVVASSGDKKSPALRIAMKPAYEEQKRLVGEHREALARYKEELAIWEERKKAAKKGERTPPRPQEPELRHVYVNDVTIEELAVILSKTARGLLAVWDELSGFFTSMDQYKAGGRGGERAKYLSMWQGGPPLKVDRRSEDTVYADRPLVSVTGTIQPGILPELNRRHSSIARTPNADDGMAHRFLFSYPKRPVILRDLTDYDVSPVTDTWYGFLYQELRNLEPDEDGDPVEVRFSEDGEKAFDRRNEEFNKLRYRPGVTEAFASTIAKISSSQLARVSLLFCLIRSAMGGGPEEVGEEDVERAARVIEYFLAHARRVHAVLFPEKTDQRILRVLGDLLKERGDYWKVAPEELRGALKERGAFDVPERPDELTKKLLKLSEAEECLIVKRAWFHDKRALEIQVLPPPAPDAPGDGVGGVGTGNAPEDGVLLRKGSDLVMFVLRQRGAAFPDEIAEATGLTYGTIKKVVSQLRGEGVVEDTGELRGQSRQVRLAQRPAVTLMEDEGSGRDG